MAQDFDEYPGRGRHQGDLVVKPQEFVYILDETKGQVSIIVGPQKMSLAGTDKPVRYDVDERRFVECTPEEAINLFVSAHKGSYIELQNPSTSSDPHPRGGTISPLADLDHGCKVNINGPAFFALWPGQVASVLEGHNLRSNQYLVCRVYDDEAAQENLHEAVIKTQTEGEDEGPKAKKPNNSNLLPEGDELVTGKLFVIKGTDVSFFIPPNGIEVLPDNERNYIRSAVTLEQLEYTILLDENGDKRFERGPQVVFPKPTERFLKRKMGNGKPSRRFRAIELNEISGIYVKVIAPYEENTDRYYEEGEELWITGKEQRIYFPRAEHSLIRYGDREIHYAVAIPKGESKYVLNRDTGEIRTIEGPAMFLPDPRKEVIVRRILDDDKAQLWFPDNEMVLEYNQALAEAATSAADGFITDRQFKKKGGRSKADLMKGGAGGGLAELLSSYSSPHAGGFHAGLTSRGTAPIFDETEMNEAVYDQPDDIVGDKLSRKAQFTKPVAVEIDAKMDGAIKIRPWTGYAIQIVNGLGERRVVVGPSVVQLAYDEELESFSMSSGTPKSSDRIKRDVYLRVLNNRVSDKVTVETADMVSVTVTLSYRVNFVGDKNRWFDVENYVQHLCDNMRSMLRNLAKQHDIQSFYSDYINIIRNLITPANADGEREGRLFQENGMMVTEVEVLGCEIGDDAIQEMLEDAQRRTAETLIELNQNKKLFDLDSARAELDKARAELKTATTAALEEETRKRMVEEEKTSTTQHAVSVERLKREFAETMARVNNEAEREKTEMEVRLALVDDETIAMAERQKVLDEIHEAESVRNKASHDERLRVTQAETLDYVNRLKAEAQKEVEMSGAVQPGLVEALTALGQSGMLEKITKDLAPLAIVRGLSVGGAISQLFEGTPFEKTVQQLVENVKVEGGNGAYGARFTTKRPEHDEANW